MKDQPKLIFGNAATALRRLLHKNRYSQHFVLTDDNTSLHCLPVLREELGDDLPLNEIKVYAGEQHKTLQAAEYVWQQLTRHGADRYAVLINLGGGMICDLGGFAAATYKRGIAFMHVPTSLLAQADAAYGGKQGIDFMHYKNHVGVFAQPVAVINDVRFLQTLPREQLLSGFAEIIKHTLISSRKDFKKLRDITDLSSVHWNSWIKKSIAVKLKIVDKDPYEQSLRKVLNFGHTLGHALESLLLHRRQHSLHGYCVAYGMIGELALSTYCCGLKHNHSEDAIAFIRRHFPPLTLNEADIPELLGLLLQDKKNHQGQVRFSLLKKMGKPVVDVVPTETQIVASLHRLINAYPTEAVTEE